MIHRQNALKKMKEWRKNNSAYVADYQRKYKRRYKKNDPKKASRLHMAGIKRYRINHREKHLAHQSVWNGVRHGTIIKPSNCQKCGKRKWRKNIHAHHHHGYKDRRNIIWLCSQCHSEEHRKASKK